MNIIAVDIGNSNINIGFFLEDQEKYTHSIPGDDEKQLAECLKSAWEQIPIVEGSTEKKRNGVIVASSVKPDWTDTIRNIALKDLGEAIYVVGKDIPLPIDTWVDEPEKVGTDRVILAAAAYAVVEAAVIVIDVGSAVTIDYVDDHGIFQGGVICPGLQMAADALARDTAQLPQVKLTKPTKPFGKNTENAISAGIYYSIVGTLQEVVRRFAEEIGKWPQTVMTGAGAKLILEDCPFIDSYVPNLVVRGIVLAYKKYVESKI